jgi:osmotically-inducible protein OsmY
MKNPTLPLLSLALLLVGCNGHDPKEPTVVQVEEAKPQRPHLLHDKQQETAADQAISQLIIQALNDNAELSDNAKNIEVLTASGVVKLYGQVNSLRDKEIIIKTISDLAAPNGLHQVNSQLEIITPQK